MGMIGTAGVRDVTNGSDPIAKQYIDLCLQNEFNIHVLDRSMNWSMRGPCRKNAKQKECQSHA